MNHWQTILTFGPMWVGNKVLQLFGWMGNRADEIRSYLKKLQWYGGIGMLLGIIISAAAFHNQSDTWITIGRYITTIFGLFAAYCLMNIWGRLAAIAIPASAIATGATTVANQAVKFVPGAPQITITNVIDEDTIKNILKEVMSVFSWMMFVVLYVSIIPAYRNPLLFIGCVILAAFLGMATYGWDLPTRIDIQQKFTYGAAILLLCNTLWIIAPFVIPQAVNDRYDLMQAKQAADHKIVEGYQKDIASLSQERETLARTWPRDANKQARLDFLSARIEDLTDGKGIDSPQNQEADPSGFFTGLPVGKTTFGIIAALSIIGLCIKKK